MRIELISLFISFVALVFSTTLTLHSFKLQKLYQRFEHESKEKTKEDLLKILASLRLIVAKASITNYCKNLTFVEEKKAVQCFLVSVTWTAMQYSFFTTQKRSLLWLHLLFILDSEDIGVLAHSATEAEKELHGFIERDGINTLNALKEDFRDVLVSFSDNKSTDEIMKLLYQTTEKKLIDKDKYFINFLYYIRDIVNISDYDVDLFIAVFENDISLLEKALNAGGNPHVTQGEILKKYNCYLSEFEKKGNKE